jgi:hypothetical protein
MTKIKKKKQKLKIMVFLWHITSQNTIYFNSVSFFFWIFFHSKFMFFPLILSFNIWFIRDWISWFIIVCFLYN